MGKHQRTLEIFQIVRGNARLRQQTKTGVDTVGGTPLGNNGFNAGHAVVNGGMGAFIQRERDRLTPDVTQLFERERAGSEC